MEPIILASSSPRRQDILKMLNIPFQVIIPGIDESSFSSKTPEELPEILAKAKVQAVIKSRPTQQVIDWVLGADTVVIHDSKTYGKPKNHEEAFSCLKELQGKTHTVVTSIALYNGKTHITNTKTAISKVTFSPMTDKEIEWYVETGDWHGAAGGYRIQGLASCFITKIEGTSSCVIGLPICELYDILKAQGYSIID